ncbi:Hypothetical protein HDN1F_23390 [gamma proteobacterium HdN1]|nr:Hypothetical protein HDN1F_23390 [gamma proteobacterium HdN1]
MGRIMDTKKCGHRLINAGYFIALTALLTACGGDDPSNLSADGQGGNSDGSTSDVVRLGFGAGSTFVDNMIGTVSGTLSAGGRTTLTVNIVDKTGTLITDETAVTFNSNCISNEDSTLSEASVTTSTGTATTTYTAAGCVGDDTVTATISTTDQVLRATTTLSIASAEVGAVSFVSSSANNLAFQDTGDASRPSFTTLTFKIADKNGNGIKGKTLNFEPSTTVGGVSLSSTSAVSDKTGAVVTTLNAGTVSTSVRVKATYKPDDGEAIYTTTPPININIGIPDQDSFSISLDDFNPNALNYDGIVVNVTVHSGDRNNNFVPDGTIINFMASAGSIPGSCEIAQGACSVAWVSAGDRPSDGKVTILARTAGEESFNDVNSNGRFDLEELSSVTQVSDAWLDVNWNRNYDAGTEPYFDFNNDGIFTPKDALFNGTNCSDAAAQAGHCKSLIEVRADTRIVMSGDNFRINLNNNAPLTLGVAWKTVTVKVSDELGNCPPSGSTVKVTVPEGSEAQGSTSFTVPKIFNCSGPVEYSITLRKSATTTETGGPLSVDVSAPSSTENKVTASIPVTFN